jgi:hypothetical protein
MIATLTQTLRFSFTNINFKTSALISLFSVLTLNECYAQTDAHLSKSLSEAKAMINESNLSQERIDQSISQTLSLQKEFRAISNALKETNINLAHKRKVHSLQLEKIEDLEVQLSEISNTENSLMPMLLDLIDWLEIHVNNDIPFDSKERLNRIEQLKRNSIDPEISISHLYHAVLEAYQIENEYGYSIDTYKHRIELTEGAVEVQILRIGRIGLYYLSLDSTHGGHWNSLEKNWINADPQTLKQIAQGIKIAKKQAPSSLLTLPIEIQGERQ